MTSLNDLDPGSGACVSVHEHGREVLLCRGVRIVSAAAGERHSVALGSHGCMYTWGCGRHGQLGLENVAEFVALNMAAPVAVHQPQRVSSLDPNFLDPWNRYFFLFLAKVCTQRHILSGRVFGVFNCAGVASNQVTFLDRSSLCLIAG